MRFAIEIEMKGSRGRVEIEAKITKPDAKTGEERTESREWASDVKYYDEDVRKLNYIALEYDTMNAFEDVIHEWFDAEYMAREEEKEARAWLRLLRRWRRNKLYVAIVGWKARHLLERFD